MQRRESEIIRSHNPNGSTHDCISAGDLGWRCQSVDAFLVGQKQMFQTRVLLGGVCFLGKTMSLEHTRRHAQSVTEIHHQ